MTSFPDSWDVRPLGEVVEVLDSQRVPVSADERANRVGDVPYYGAAGQVGWIDEALFNEPLVMLGEDGVQFFDANKPKSYLIDGPAWVNNHAHVLRAREMVERRFLSHYLNAADYRGFANGTTRLKLTQAAMRQIPVPVPPLDEQHWIVELLEDHLSRLDAAADDLTAASARQALLHDQLFAAALAGIETTKVRFTDLLASRLSNGRSIPTEDNGFPVLRLTAYTSDGGIDLSRRKGGAWSADDAARFLVQRGDFLIARGNGSLRLVGRGGLVREDPDPVAYPDTMIRAQPDTTKLIPEYLAFAWNSPIVRQQIEAIARTTAGIYKVNQRDLGSISLPVPSLDDQFRVIAAVQYALDALAKLIFECDRARLRSERLRRSLLATALSGRLTDTSVPEVREMMGT